MNRRDFLPLIGLPITAIPLSFSSTQESWTVRWNKEVAEEKFTPYPPSRFTPEVKAYRTWLDQIGARFLLFSAGADVLSYVTAELSFSSEGEAMAFRQKLVFGELMGSGVRELVVFRTS